MRALIYILRRLYLHEQYYTAFLCAERIAKRLEVVGGDIDPAEEKNIWYDLGRLYFDFCDYEIAIPYLKAALQDTPVPRYYNLYNLQARNALGLYYRNIGELDLPTIISVPCWSVKTVSSCVPCSTASR